MLHSAIRKVINSSGGLKLKRKLNYKKLGNNNAHARLLTFHLKFLLRLKKRRNASTNRSQVEESTIKLTRKIGNESDSPGDETLVNEAQKAISREGWSVSRAREAAHHHHHDESVQVTEAQKHTK